MLTPQVLYKFCTRNCSGFKRLFTRKSQDFERLGLSIEKHFNLKFSQIVKFSKIRENIQRQSCSVAVLLFGIRRVVFPENATAENFVHKKIQSRKTGGKFKR